MSHESIVDAVEESLGAADHLGPLDAAAVATVRGLAHRVDELIENGGFVDGRLDNTTVPSFLRYLESLGLTPGSRRDLNLKGASSERAAKLVALRTKRTA